MSIFSTEQNPNVLFCNQCGRMFQIDSSYVLNSCAQQPLLSSLASARGGNNTTKGEAKHLKRTFEAVKMANYSPWRGEPLLSATSDSNNNEGKDAAATADPAAVTTSGAPTCFRHHDDLPAHLTEHLQWSSRFLTRPPKALRIDSSVVPTTSASSSAVEERKSPAELYPNDRAAVSSPLHVKNGGTFQGITWQRETNRPRGNPRGAEYPPGVSIAKERVIRIAWSVFGAVSQHAQQDMPLCPRCWRQSIQTTQRELNMLAEDVACLEGIRVRMESSATEGQDNLATLYRCPAAAGTTLQEMLSDEGRAAEEELAALDAQLEDLRQEELQLAIEEAALAEVEQDVRAARAHSDHQSSWLTHDRLQAHQVRLAQLQAEDMRVASLTMLTELFVIDTAAPVATINGLRVGYLPTTTSGGSASGSSDIVPIGIMEINCGCSYLAMVLQTLASRNHLSLQYCTIRVKSCETTIETILPGKKEVSELTFHIVDRFFAWKTFGAACCVFADGVRQVSEFLQRALQNRLSTDSSLFPASITSWSLKPPHAMGDGVVGGASVKHGTANEETWTLGMRNLMDNLQWCLVAQNLLEISQRESIQRRASHFAAS